MPLPLIGAAIAGIGGVAKIIQGIRQRKEAKNLKKSNFIPTSLKESVKRLRSNASSRFLPGYNQAKENIQQNTSNVIRTAGSGSISDKLNMAQSATVNANDAMVDLETKGAEFQQQNEDRLNQGLTQKANVEMANEQQFRQTKQQLLNSGSQNIVGGISDISSVGATAAAGGFSNGKFKSVLNMDNAKLKEAINKGYIDLESYTPEQRIKISEKLGR